MEGGRRMQHTRQLRTTPCPAIVRHGRPEPARHARRAPGGGERRRRGAAPAPEPVGHEPRPGPPSARRRATRSSSAPAAALVPTPRAPRAPRAGGPPRGGGGGRPAPTEPPDLARLERTFTVRASEGFAETFGPALLARLAREAPGVRLWFVAKASRDSGPLRDGSVELDVGVMGQDTGDELRLQTLYPRPVRGRRPGQAPAREGPPDAGPLRGRPARRGVAPARSGGPRRSTPPSPRSGSSARWRRRSAASARPWPWPAPPTSWPPSPSATPPACARGSGPSRCPSRRRRSPSPCSGTPGSTPTRPTPGCASGYATCAGADRSYAVPPHPPPPLLEPGPQRGGGRRRASAWSRSSVKRNMPSVHSSSASSAALPLSCSSSAHRASPSMSATRPSSPHGP
jgi:hypothetical protein